MNPANGRQVLDCASPLALSTRPVITRTAGHRLARSVLARAAVAGESMHAPMLTRWGIRLLTVVTCLLAGVVDAQAAEPVSPASILPELRSFREMGSVLYVAAHPDDENTQLIAYLARGRYYRTAYLSVTRGDGGQNVLGPELDEKLGVARTQELLAARRLDGGRQFFTRAIDFGFSKDYRETLKIWDREQVVSDIVRIIRTFRPDVIVTRFSPEPSGTHGHHTASAVLALEAFKLAGDPKAFPDQLVNLTPWQPRRILVNGRGGGTNAGNLQIEIAGNDPVLDISFGELAGRSRAMHKTQGFGSFGGRGGGGPRPESFQLLDGEPATNDILDGVDTTWNRVPGGADIGKLADEIITKFNSQDPAASVPALLELRSRLAALPTKDPVVIEKRAQLDRILQSCLGLSVETAIPQADVVPGEPLKMRHTAMVRSAVPVRWLAVRYPAIKGEVKKIIDLRANEASTRDSTQTLPANTPLTQPYWLRAEGTPGMYRVDDAMLIGQPENPSVFPIEQVFEVGGQTLVVPDEPVQVIADAAKGEVRRRLDVIPPVSLSFSTEVALFSPGASRPVEVEVTAFRAGTAGALELDIPAGWKVAPTKQPFRLATVGERTRLRFTVTAPAQAVTAKIVASAETGGVRYSNDRVEIRYSHIPPQLLLPVARLKAISLELAIRGRKVGYLPGAGDSVDDSLKQMGYTVTTLTDTDLTLDKLHGLDAVVIGVRAFNVRTNLAAQLPGLFAYVEAGGTVVAQYNRPGRDQKSEQLGPYSLRLSNDRVTDETAPVTFLAPDHPVLNRPNKITAADFTGWIQERGIYFPNQWDDHFTPILACGDPGEAPLKGGLLVAPYGKGYYIYTGLVFFRELPAGVPGAWRLFANLVSLGK
jgi:LmbE family N-acetylglucosaminyl deacetylase